MILDIHMINHDNEFYSIVFTRGNFLDSPKTAFQTVNRAFGLHRDLCSEVLMYLQNIILKLAS